MTWHFVIGGRGENGKKNQSQIQLELLDLNPTQSIKPTYHTQTHVGRNYHPKQFFSILIFKLGND